MKLIVDKHGISIKKSKKHIKNELIALEKDKNNPDNIQFVSKNNPDNIQFVSKNNPDNIQFVSKNNPDNIQFVSKNNPEKKPVIYCQYCNTKFNHKNNYYRHVNSRCKVKQEKDRLEKEEKKKEEIEIHDHKIEIEEQKIKLEAENQKFIIQFMEKQAEEQRKREEKQAEEQRKREEKQAEEQMKREERLIQMVLSCQNNKGENIGDIYEKIEKMIDQKLHGSDTSINNSENHHNHNNGTIFEAKNQNNLLNNLNLNYTNVISMEKFLYNMEHVNKIPKSDLEAIAYASENMKEDDLAEALHKTIIKNCEEQTKGIINEEDGLELIPVLPVVCSDGNCRSHKEKVKKLWETVYANNHFDKMLNIIDKRIYEVLKKKIYLEENGKTKLFNKIKRKHTIHDMESMQQKINGDKKGKPFKNAFI